MSLPKGSVPICRDHGLVHTLLIKMTIDAVIGGTWDIVLSCPTCGSTDRDVFLPVRLFFFVRRCPDAWHEDRLVKKTKVSPAKAASRQTRIVTKVVKSRHEGVLDFKFALK